MLEPALKGGFVFGGVARWSEFMAHDRLKLCIHEALAASLNKQMSGISQQEAHRALHCVRFAPYGPGTTPQLSTSPRLAKAFMRAQIVASGRPVQYASS